MSTRSRFLGGYSSSSSGPSSYSYYPSYFSTPFYSTGYSGGYSSYYSRSSSGYTPSSSYSGNTTRTPRDTSRPYRGARTDSDLLPGLRSKSVDPGTLLAREASVTRELYTEPSSYTREPSATPAREDAAPRPPPRSKRWGSTVSLASTNTSSVLPDWVSSASNRFSKATSSLYQKSRGALGMLRSSSLYDLRGSTSDLRGSTQDLRGSTSDLRGSTSDLRGSISNLRSLRGSMSDIRGSTSNLRGSTADLRGSTSDLRGSTTSLATSRQSNPVREVERRRRQTTQVSEFDLARARVWSSAGREGGEGRARGTLEQQLGGSRSTVDLGYSSRRGSEERQLDYRKVGWMVGRWWSG